MSGGVRGDARKRDLSPADLADLIAAHEAAQEAWISAKSYEDAAYETYRAAGSELLMAYAALERAK